MLSQEELQVIRERVELSTLGPWKSFNDNTIVQSSTDNDGYRMEIGKIRRHRYYQVDADFIAHAREDVPKLLDEIEKLQTHALAAQVDEFLKLGVSMRREIERLGGALEYIQRHRMLVGETAYIAARNALGNEGKSYAQIYGGQEDPTVAFIKQRRQTPEIVPNERSVIDENHA